jgi:hypothetical protein
MKVAFYAMLKNEQTITPAFAEMLNEFADYIYIVDHESTDDTFEIIRNKTRNAKIYKLTSNRYPQSEVSNFFARLIFTETDAEFLFFLDADEFIPFNTKQDLHTFLIENTEYDVIQIPWNNLSPKGRSFDSGFTSMGPSENYSKIILSRSIRNVPDYKIAQGNHLVTSDCYTLRVKNQRDKQLLHIPVLSYTNLLIKLINGIRSLENDVVNKVKGNGYHWYSIAMRVTTEALTQNQLNDIIYHYSGSMPAFSKEVDLVFYFPYIKTRILSVGSTDDILLSCLSAIIGGRPKGGAEAGIDIMLKDDNENVVYLKKHKVFTVFMEVLFHRLKSLIPQSTKKVAKRLRGQRN